MTYNVGVNDKVNGNSKAGEFLTGNMDFFSVATLVPMAQTNVTTPVALLYTQQGYSTWQSVTVVDGAGTAQTYSNQSDYQDALNLQANLDLLIRLFAQRANPVAISVSSVSDSDPATTSYAGFAASTHFGSHYTSTMTVTTVKFATEKTSLWLATAAADSATPNADGYQLLAALDGIAIADLDSPVLAGGAVFNTSNSTYRNTLAVRALYL
jgi:hypothetical protein